MNAATSGPENSAVATMPHVTPDRPFNHTVYVFFAHVPIDPCKHVMAVGFPAISANAAGHVTAMHIFGIGVG